MPSIDVAMERSIRRGAMDLLAATLRPVVERRDAVTAVTGVPAQINDWKQSFSSWNSCMQANYCKYPVIALIVIGGLIILSVIWCIARCACCGLSCCCECFYCLKCCGNCCGCCDPPGGRKHKYLDDEPYAPPTQGYRSEAPMSAGPLGGGFKPAAHPAVHPAVHHEPPQYAEFDVSKKGSDDALPEMPSWEGAGNKKVMLDNEAMEMENLKKPENSGQNMPLMTGASPGPASPASPENRSPYGPPPGGAYGSNPYLPPAGGMGDQYGRNSPGYNGNGRGYGPSSSSLAVDQGYGMAGGAGPMGPGRRSPRDYNNGGGYRMPNQGGYPGPQSRQGSNDDFRRNVGGGPGVQEYDMGNREPRLPDVMGGGGGGGYNDQPPRRSPQPRGDYGYGNGGDRGYGNAPYPPQRNYSSESQRPLAARPPPQRQYSSNTGPASSPSLQNNSGFDFNSGYSRPPTQGRDEYDYGRRPSGGNQGGGGYPGYKPYQPSDPRQPEGWSGL